MNTTGDNSRNDLPHGWAWASLGDLGRYHNGRGFKKSEWRKTGRPIIRIQNLTNPVKPFNHFDGEVEPRHEVHEGDILVSWAATLDAFIWRGPEAVLNQHIFKVESDISPRFHYYVLKAVLSDIRAQAHGSGMVHVTRKRFLNTPVRLPPLAEQDRIVAAIEHLSASLDTAEHSVGEAERRLTALRHGTLEAAMAGHERVELGTLVSELRYGTSVKCSYEADGPPVLRIPNVKAGTVDLSDVKFADDGDLDLSPFVLERGDLLFVRTNGSRDLIGRVASVEGAEGMAFASYLIRARPDPSRLDSRFAVMALSTPSSRALIESKAATTAGQYNLNLAALRSFPIPLPPIGEQRSAVEEVERRLLTVTAMDDAVKGVLSDYSALSRSILRRAFTGKLVAQDPSDKPASELLDGPTPSTYVSTTAGGGTA